MKRRDFFAASAVAGLALGTAGLTEGAEGAGDKELYELRKYTFDSVEKLEVFAKFLEEAVPALNRAGIEPVGVMRLFKDDNPKLKDLEGDPNELWVLMPHKSLESVVTLNERIMDDSAWDSAGAEAVLMAVKKDPAYLRYESSLLLAFDGIPKLEVHSEKDTRLMQLRIYESHTIERHVMKTHMFNEGGEIEIFRKTGMNPVFFGQALVGSLLPNLTYMLQFDDQEALDTAWAAFLAHPDWNSLKSQEQYKDTVSRITNLILRPTAASQI